MEKLKSNEQEDIKEVSANQERINFKLSQNLKEEYTIEDIDGYINKISKSVLQEQMNKISTKIKNSTNYEEKLELIEKLSNLKKQEQEL